MPTIRDFQRKRAYTFEDFYTNKNRYAKVFSLSKNQCRGMVNQIFCDYGHSSKIAHVTFYDCDSAHCWELGDVDGMHINIPLKMRNAIYVLHEIAHSIVALDYNDWNLEAAHGPIFVATLIDLLEHYCDYDGQVLREEAVSWGLKIAEKYLIPKRIFNKQHAYCFKQAA